MDDTKGGDARDFRSRAPRSIISTFQGAGGSGRRQWCRFNDRHFAELFNSFCRVQTVTVEYLPSIGPAVGTAVGRQRALRLQTRAAFALLEVKERIIQAAYSEDVRRAECNPCHPRSEVA